MRRIVTVVIATVGGLALLASFHTTPGVSNKAIVGLVPSTRPPAGGSPPPGSTAPGSTAPGSTTPPSAGPGSSAPGTTAPATGRPASRTIDGPVVSNQYGDVQVEVVVAGGRLVDVEALQLPMDRRRSAEISSFAGPELRQEALQAGNASIDGVAGASYTSQSYAESLQAALDQVGL